MHLQKRQMSNFIYNILSVFCIYKKIGAISMLHLFRLKVKSAASITYQAQPPHMMSSNAENQNNNVPTD